MSISTSIYLQADAAEREDIRTSAFGRLRRSREEYVDLLAAEAMLAARVNYPTAARLVFDVGEDLSTPTTSLIAVYDEDGTRLWHVDYDDEYPDESEVTDFLAAALDYGDDRYDPFNEADEGMSLSQYTLPNGQ